jgi:PAS domain S-box-containing protein
MKKKSATPPDAAEIRRQAEAKLTEREKKEATPPTTEAYTQRLVRELQVYQSELEMRNEELVQSRAEAKTLLRQFADLYDFVPAGYFTLAPDGVIHMVNLAGANLLGIERGALINQRIGVFVSERSRTTFSAFLDDVFTSGSKEVSEVQLLKDGAAPFWVHIEAIRGDGQREVCRAVVTDITERKQMENDLRKSEEAQRVFSERLTNMLKAINDLSKSETFDDLCRNAVVSAKRLMNLDRVGIWFFLPDHRTMQSSFGMDENGNLRDERGIRLPIMERHINELVPSKKPIILFDDEDLRDYQGNIVGKGSHVVAGLWNGEGIIGLLGADNLIRKHPILESDIKLLDLYAVSLGHLCTLKRAEEQIRKDLREKEVMLREIHHRVKNNLNVITSLLSLQADQITDKSQALAAFEESKNRIYAMALVHENLYKEQDYSRINMKSFVEDMTQNLLRVYHPSVKIDIRIQDLTLDLNNAVPCGLILNELVTNALKHAFKDKSQGLITIGFRVLNGNIYELTVQDNGIGLPKEIDISKLKSLGLVIVNQLLIQIDGALKITRGKGTQFQITFPVSEGA